MGEKQNFAILKKEGVIQINTSNLNSGLYMLNIQSSKGNIRNRRFIRL